MEGKIKEEMKQEYILIKDCIQQLSINQGDNLFVSSDITKLYFAAMHHKRSEERRVGKEC